jgi:hypothetical protein
VQYVSISKSGVFSPRPIASLRFSLQIFREQKGGMLLYALAVLPVMLSISVLAVDFSRFQSLRTELQKEADRIALQAAKSLPETEAARSVVIDAARASGLELEFLEDGLPAIEVTASTVSFSLKAEREALLDIFLQAAGAKKKIFEINARTSAAIVPEDYVLIVSDALSLRPEPRTYWGDEDTWPKAPILSLLRPPRFSGGNSPQAAQGADSSVWSLWWNDWSNGYQRWVTQSCYNPIYSSVKMAAIAFAKSVGRNPNRLGLIFSPGESSSRQFTVARELAPGGVESQRDALWNAYVETDNFISDEACVLFAPPNNWGEPYQAAAPSDSLGCNSAGESCLCEADLVVPSQSGAEYFPIGLFGECRNVRKVSIEEAIYYHASRNVYHGSQGENITSAIREAYRSLSSARSLPRPGGSTAQLAKQKIVVISDVLPDPTSSFFLETQDWLERAGISLVLIPVVLEGIPGYSGALKSASELLRAYGSLHGRQVFVFPLSSLDEVSSSLIPTLANGGREYVIQS